MRAVLGLATAVLTGLATTVLAVLA
ncbi:MAG: hypothetical protein QOE53_992, partial [Pseudonocardiales bacterium]|nr:hypothetical protein [Pseudonocardiales bacterium]